MITCSLVTILILFSGSSLCTAEKHSDEVEDSIEHEKQLLRKAQHENYEKIVHELTSNRSATAIAEFSEIMNNQDQTREERNDKLDEWGEKNDCETAVGLFKIKEELIEEEERKVMTQKIDMLSSVTYQLRDVMQDAEMAEYEKKEVIDTLVQSSSDKVKPLLYELYPSLLKEQPSSEEIIGLPGQSYLDKLTDTNEIIMDISRREELTMKKKKQMIEGFISQAKPRVANVLRLLWTKNTRKRRHLKHVRTHMKVHTRNLKTDIMITKEDFPRSVLVFK